MKNLKIMNSLTRTFHKVGFKVKKHSPEILVVTGVIGTVASAVMACKATTKLSAVLEESKKDINDIHNYVETHGYSEQYTEQDGKKDLTIVYAQTGVKLVKLYAPAVALGAISITSILAGHNILHKRNVALAAAYATVDNGFKEYRNRVVERFGKELDRELKYNIKAKEIEETVVNEDGTETTVKKTATVMDINRPSEYAVFFAEGCPGWEKDADHNKYFLQCQEHYANQKLQAQGYLFLNEVYEMIGVPKTKAGHVMGWIYDEEHPVGDNYVDFGLTNMTGIEHYDERKRAFVNGWERSVLVDFNLDGNIYELMS